MSCLQKFTALPVLLTLVMVATAANAAPSVVVPEKVAAKTKLKMAPTDTLIYVGDMHCGHCAKKIASKLYAVKGVVKVRTDVKADIAIITPQKKKTLDPLALWSAANASGFPALKLVGPTGTYVVDADKKTAKKVVKTAAKTPGA